MFGRIFVAAWLLLAGLSSAAAQSGCSYIAQGANLTPAQWNFCFSQKQNALGYSPVNKAGDTMTGRLTLAPSTTLSAGINVAPGVAPTSPNNGDLWVTTAGIFVRVNGATVGPLVDSTGGSFAAAAPLAVSFPSGVVTYSLPNGTADQVLRMNAGGTASAFGSIDLSKSAAVGASILPLANGGTNAALTASNGGIVYSSATALAVLSGTATAGQIVRSGSSAAPSWSTATYPATAAQGTVLAAGSANVISATATPTLGVAGTTLGTLALAGNTSGSATITPQATAGSPTLTLPNASGTFAVGASGPLVLSATTGNLTCPTCATTTSGGAISGTSPIAVSAGGAISINANGIGFTLLTQSTGPSVVGRSANTLGNNADITGTASQFLGVNAGGTAVAFQTMGGDATLSGATLTIGANLVTYAKFQQVAASSLVGNPTGSLANAQGITLNATLGFSGTTLTCTTATSSQIGCLRPDNTTITISGGVITAIGAAATSVSVGTTTIASGTSGRVLYDNAGVLGEIAAVMSFNGATGTVASNAANKVCFVSTAGNDSNSGLSRETPKLTHQACEDLLATAGTVYVMAGTYTLSATYAKRPGVTTFCEPGAVFTQANGTNLTNFINFSTNSAHFGQMQGKCKYDGNRANNLTENGGLIQIGNADDVTIAHGIFVNSPGPFINILGTGKRWLIDDNDFDNAYSGISYCQSGVANNPTKGTYRNNRVRRPGFHVFALLNCDGVTHQDNIVTANRITGLVASINGTAVTLTTGVTTGAIAGDAFIYDNGTNKGTEGIIASITDSTHFVLGGSSGVNVTGKAGAIGTGDMFSCDTSSDCVYTGNKASGGVTGTYVLFNGSSAFTQTNLGAQVVGNAGNDLGGSPVGVFALTGKTMKGVSIVGNSWRNIGMDAGASADQGRVCLYFEGVDLDTATIVGNSCTDDQASPTMTYFAWVNGQSAGKLRFGPNTTFGSTIAGDIHLGISSVQINVGGSSWGTGGTVTSSTSGHALTFTITAGTTPATFPLAIVNTVATSSDDPPKWMCQFIGGTGYGTGAHAAVSQITPAAFIMTFVATPVSGSTYTFNCNG
jgi:hypothetical protein